MAAADDACQRGLPLAASRACSVPSAAPTKTRPRAQIGAVGPPGSRRRHSSRTLCPTAAVTVAVPAALARNIGQSSLAAGWLEAGAVQAGPVAGAAARSASVAPCKRSRGPASNRRPAASNTTARWPAARRRNSRVGRRPRSWQVFARRCSHRRSAPRRRRAGRRIAWGSPSGGCRSRLLPGRTGRGPCP